MRVLLFLLLIPEAGRAADAAPEFAPVASFYHTDQDTDGIDDSIEAAVAARFAPEYRFYKRIDDSRLVTPDPLQLAGDPAALPRRSPQNQSERFFPCAVEHLHPSPPTKIPVDCPGGPAVYYHSYLHRIVPSGRLAKWIAHRGWREEIVIEYWTFYTFDDKGLGGWLDHVGDWEHVNVLVTRRFDTIGRWLGDEIVEAVYYGHATERILAADIKTNRCTRLTTKGIRVPGPSLLMVEGTHPMVFVSAGTHASYPWPGIWQNLTCQGPGPTRIGTYDDLFLGNGRVLSSWQEGSLINLGEVDVVSQQDLIRSRDPKQICRRRQLLEKGLICDTGQTTLPAVPMPDTPWNTDRQTFGMSRDPMGRISSPVAPAFHNVWGLFDPIAGYPYTQLPEDQRRLIEPDHTPWETVMRMTGTIPDGLGKLRTSKTFTLP